MDAPTLSPPEPVETAPATTPVAPVPPSTPHTARSAQIALVGFLALTLGLLAFRGYGAWLGARPTETARPALVDLNHAGRADLEQVPGIGPSLAKEIADDRERRGPFRSVEELRRVKGMGPVTFDKVRAYLRVEPSAAPGATDLEPLVLERKPTQPTPAPYPRTGGSAKKIQPGDPPINANTASAEELTRLPAIGPVTAQNIIAARDVKPFRTVADLDAVKGIGPKTMEKIRPFVVVE
jgi:competence protein ComEA